jgi:mRNA interferase MazF
MTDYDFGDVVLVPFPFTDQTTTKKRPAVVVSSAVYNRARPDFVLMAVTGQIKPSASFGGVAVTQWKEAGLLKPSVIKPIFTTVEKGLVLKRLRRLRKKDRQALQEAVLSVLGE